MPAPATTGRAGEAAFLRRETGPATICLRIDRFMVSFSKSRIGIRCCLIIQHSRDWCGVLRFNWRNLTFPCLLLRYPFSYRASYRCLGHRLSRRGSWSDRAPDVAKYGSRIRISRKPASPNQNGRIRNASSEQTSRRRRTVNSGEMGWPTGFEPATTRSTIWGSNQAELRPPQRTLKLSFEIA